MKNVRTFQASSMREALLLVKRELGEEAVILGTRSFTRSGLGGLIGKAGVEITAAQADDTTPAPRIAASASPIGARSVTARTRADEAGYGPRVSTAREPIGARPVPPHSRRDEAEIKPFTRKGGGPSVADMTPSGPRPKRRTSTPPMLPEEVFPYYSELIQNEVGEHLARRLARQAKSLARAAGKPVDMRGVLRQAIAKMIPVTGAIALDGEGPRRVALVGPSGGGKTTTLAKLAAHVKLRLRKRVAIVSLDMQRLAGSEQVRRYAEIIGVPVYTAQTPAAVTGLFEQLEPVDVVLIDTQGVSAAESEQFARLTELLGTARPDEVHLVLPASMAASVQARVGKLFGPLGVGGVVLTHLDEAVGLGVVLNAIEKLEWGLSYVSRGQRVPTDLEEACAERMADLVFPVAEEDRGPASRATRS